jgi:hypothetical protein
VLTVVVLLAALAAVVVAVVCVVAQEDPQWPPVRRDPEPEGGPDLIDWCRDNPDRIHAPDTLEEL